MTGNMASPMCHSWPSAAPAGRPELQPWATTRAGLDVTLVEQDFEPGGSLLAQPVDSAQAQWLGHMVTELRASAKVHMMTRATAFGLYDGNTVGVAHSARPDWPMPNSACHANACIFCAPARC